MPMKLKTVTVEGTTYAAVDDNGLPIYVHDDGKESGFDAAGAAQRISALNGEAKGHRERAEAAESKLKSFEGIDDPDAARKAVATVANLDEKKLVDAGEVQKVKDAAIKAVRDEYEPVVKERDGLKSALDNEIIGGSFDRSTYVKDNVAVPSHMLRATYGGNFKVEDGKLVPYDANGEKIRSRTNPGDVASFDEAIESLIAADPARDHILKGSGHGGGAPAKGGRGGGATLTRAEFDSMSPTDKVAKVKEGVTVVDA